MIGKEEGLRKVCAHYEQVENYEQAVADEENKWELHHRNEIDENKSAQQLKDEGRYYDVEPEELIFLLHSEHTRLHMLNALPETRKKWSKAASKRTCEKSPFYGKTHTEAVKKRLSEMNKCEKHPLFGKHHSAETKSKMSAASKCKHWWNNGEISVFSKECPEGFVKGRMFGKTGENHPMFGKHHSEEAKQKMSDAKKGLHWWNNGKINIRAKECPDGFVKGRLRK